jgi:TetR/AcrR family acrAB operon transcriptional repressor
VAELRAPRTKEEVVKDFRTSAIVLAARRVIAEAGLTDASMERIAHEAGIAKGTIYLYFRNKEELFAQVVDDGFAQLLERARSRAARARGADAKLEALLVASIEHCVENQAIFRALQEHRQLAPDGTPVSVAMERNLAELVRFVAGILERGARSGELRACDAPRVARYLVESMRGAILERLREPRATSVQADAAFVVDFFLHGVGASEKR